MRPVLHEGTTDAGGSGQQSRRHFGLACRLRILFFRLQLYVQ